MDVGQECIDFDGSTFDRQIDGDRLGRQLDHVLRYLLKHPEWHTVYDLSRALGYGEQSVSARLRDLRKPKFGGYEVARRRVATGGTWEYKLGMKLA